MRIYVAGPMSGMEDHNFPAFHRAAEKLRAAGHEVLCPAENVNPAIWAVAEGMGAEFRDTPEYREIMARDFEMVQRSEAVALLTGWQHSRGAVAEKAMADCLGLETGSVEHFCERPVVAIKWTGDKKWEPKRGYSGDAGLDLAVAERCVLRYGEFVDVPCGVSVQLPEGYWAMLIGRSSTIRRKGLLVTQGIIDGGYRGPLYAGTQNMSEGTVTLEAGERIAQLIPFRLETPSLALRHVEWLGESDRGEAGFGSSGA